AFIPDSFGSGRPSAFYQFLDGTYTRNISGSSGGGSQMQSISIGGIEIEPIEERIYALLEEESGKLYGRYNIGGGITLRGSSSIEMPGTLVVTNFDPENFIISGTF